MMEEHKKGVISFSWSNSGKLVSGSWDGFAKIWQFTLADSNLAFQCLVSFGPHENAIHVLSLSNNLIVSTSTGESVNDRPANFKVRVWDSCTGKEVRPSFEPHSGSIRSVSSISGIQDGYMTSSNDGSVNLYSADGSVLGSMLHASQEDGSPPFLLDCTCLDTESGMDFVSCGEDGSLMVWRGTEPLQSVPHPSCVWCLASLPGGDFVTGGHDGKLRWFSQNPETIAAAGEGAERLQQRFLDEVHEAALRRRSGPTSEEIAKATKWADRFQTKGTSEGQVMVFNKDGSLIAAQWSSHSAAWIEIGEVTGSGDGGAVHGVRYDHVLPVEMDARGGGTVTLQLGYNNAENPFDAAQRFIDQNGDVVPQSHLRTIADWVAARSGKQTATIGPPAAASSASRRQLSLLPMKATVQFDDILAGFRSKLLGKVQDFSGLLGAAALDEEQLLRLDSLLAVLLDTSRYHSSTVPAPLLTPLIHMVARWPPLCRADGSLAMFPAMDVLRLLALHPSGAAALATESERQTLFFDCAVALLSSPTTATNTLLCAARFIANSFRHSALKAQVLAYWARHSATLLSAVRLHWTHSNKSLRLASSAVVMNAALALPAGSPATSALARCLVDALPCGLEELDLGLLVALGTAISSAGSGSGALVAQLNKETLIGKLRGIQHGSCRLCIDEMLYLLDQ